MPPAARVGDMHTCPMVTPGVPPVPHGGRSAAGRRCRSAGAGREDMATCAGPPDTIAMGSMTVLIGGMPAARRRHDRPAARCRAATVMMDGS
jgi:uncharacterized Zn-binding protein involved in type VI secretion